MIGCCLEPLELLLLARASVGNEITDTLAQPGYWIATLFSGSLSLYISLLSLSSSQECTGIVWDVWHLSGACARLSFHLPKSGGCELCSLSFPYISVDNDWHSKSCVISGFFHARVSLCESSTCVCVSSRCLWNWGQTSLFPHSPNIRQFLKTLAGILFREILAHFSRIEQV